MTKSVSKRELEEQIKNLQKEIARLRRLVDYDELTKVLNRRGFLREAERVFRRVYGAAHTRERRKKKIVVEEMAILFIDADNFKQINDLYSHTAGDMALRRLASIFSSRLRSHDIVGRWGGEEFAIMLYGANKHWSVAVAEDIRRLVSQSPLKYKRKYIPLSVSIGISVFEKHRHHNLETMIREADEAMYQAKIEGKNTVRVAK